VNYIKERKNDGWKKSRVGRLILSKGNFVSIVDIFSLSEVCILLFEKPMFLIAQSHYNLEKTLRSMLIVCLWFD